MASEAINAIGTVFNRGDGASNETFTAIAEVLSIAGPDISRDDIDVTSLDSTGGYREFISGFRNGGTIQLEVNYTQAGYLAFLADYGVDTSVNYQLILPDTGNTTLDFAGRVQTVPLSLTVNDQIKYSVTIKIDGPITASS